MTALYALTRELNELHSMLMNGEATEEHLSDTMEMIEGEFQEKALNVAQFVRSLAPSVEAIDAEIKRLQARKKAIVSKADWFKDYMKRNMEASEISKIECDLFTVSLRRGVQVAVVDDIGKLPDEFVEVKSSIQPDKKGLLKALKALEEGETIEGAHISRNEASIQIK